MASNGADTNQTQEALEKALLLLKILRKLVVYGINKLSESQDSMLFLEIVFKRAKNMPRVSKNVNVKGYATGYMGQIYNSPGQSTNRNITNASTWLY